MAPNFHDLTPSFNVANVLFVLVSVSLLSNSSVTTMSNAPVQKSYLKAVFKYSDIFPPNLRCTPVPLHRFFDDYAKEND